MAYVMRVFFSACFTRQGMSVWYIIVHRTLPYSWWTKSCSRLTWEVSHFFAVFQTHPQLLQDGSVHSDCRCLSKCSFFCVSAYHLLSIIGANLGTTYIYRYTYIYMYICTVYRYIIYLEISPSKKTFSIMTKTEALCLQKNTKLQT